MADNHSPGSVSRIDSYRARTTRLVAGVMSGTSLDGIDVALVEISRSGTDLRHRLRGFTAIPYPDELKRQLLRASSGEMSLRETFELHADLGAGYADAIQESLSAHSVMASELDAVGLHGQTVYHAPRREPHGVTVQLGSAAVVAQRLQTIVVNDFRSNDVAAGGEGAPLVPYCDYALLHAPDRNRVSLNIGGIANITWLPGDASRERLIAFDTGPGNMLIDAAMRILYNREFDAGGDVAASGTPDDNWLAELLNHPYFRLSPPKSAGRENFGEDRGRLLVIEGQAAGLADTDIVATLTKLTARTIASAINDYCAHGTAVDELIVGGGGADNATMMRMLAVELPGTRMVRSDEVGLAADAKEAICFAILANEALCEVPANVPSVTGAPRPVICGSITLP
jgi:anhydro-N-acetylmuramic acid kinase